MEIWIKLVLPSIIFFFYLSSYFTYRTIALWCSWERIKMDVLNPSSIPWEIFYKESFSKEGSQRENLKISQLQSQQKDAKLQVHISLWDKRPKNLSPILRDAIISKFKFLFTISRLTSLRLKDKSLKSNPKTKYSKFGWMLYIL